MDKLVKGFSKSSPSRDINDSFNYLVGQLDKNFRELSKNRIIDSGTVVLVAGSVLVSNSLITDTSLVFLTNVIPGGTPDFVYLSSRVSGKGFTVTSTNGTDTSTIAYLIIEP